MLRVLHCKATADGLRYRVWSTSSDQYLTEPLTESEMRELLLNEARRDAEESIGQNLARAASMGSSRRRDDRTPASDWDRERCQQCGSRHHAYSPRPDGACKSCGQDEEERTHRPPCEVEP